MLAYSTADYYHVFLNLQAAFENFYNISVNAYNPY